MYVRAHFKENGFQGKRVTCAPLFQGCSLFIFLFVHLSYLSHIPLSCEHDRLQAIICFGNLTAEKSITLFAKIVFQNYTPTLTSCVLFLFQEEEKKVHWVAIQKEKCQRNAIDVIQKQFSPLLFHKLLTICVTPEHLLILSTSKQHILIGLPLIKILKNQNTNNVKYLLIILVSLVEVQSSLWKSKINPWWFSAVSENWRKRNQWCFTDCGKYYSKYGICIPGILGF